MTQHTTPEQPGSMSRKTPQEIEAEISKTRSAMSENIKALGDKLSPEHLKEGAKEVLRDAKDEAAGMLRSAKDHAMESVSETMNELGQRARHAGHVAGDFVKVNAVPLSLIGLGAGWLMLTMRHERQLKGGGAEIAGRWQEPSNDWQAQRDSAESRARRAKHEPDLIERATGKLEEMGARVKETASEIGERASELGHDLGNKAGKISHQAREQIQVAQQKTREYADENPLAVGAVAVAAGITVGLLLPSTTAENRWMGGARDRLVGDAKDTVQRVARGAREAVGELGSTLSDSPLG